jgi:putative serine protease PepD
MSQPMNPQQQSVPPWMYPGAPYPPPRPAGRLRRNTVAVIAAATLAAGGIGGAVGAWLGDSSPTATTPQLTTTPTSDTAKATDVSSVVAKVSPSVVQVNVRTSQGEGLGSGVVLTADGRILTNNHVVADAREVTVTLSDGRTVDATVVGTAPGSDLAVIQADGVHDLTPAKFADSDSVRVGDQVIAIGSPLGLQNTVTTGIVSAVDREVNVPSETGQGTVNYHAIQTDASINQGNSGGPLFNSAGEVIGINSMIYSPVSGPDGSAGSVGLGFAIPSNTAQQVINQL